jgi:hypothetical protein
MIVSLAEAPEVIGQLALPPFPVMAHVVAPEIEFATDPFLLKHRRQPKRGR